ncbi:MAG: type II secretion system F family protein [Alphaproteobacteria bacterium]
MALQQHTILLSGFTAGAFVTAGLCFVVYNVMEWRDRVSRKVTRFRPQQTAEVQVKRTDARPVRLGGTMPPAAEREVVRRLARYGIPAERAVASFAIFRLGFGLACAMAMAVLASRVGAESFSVRMLLFATFGMVVGWFLPNSVIKMMVSRRTAAIELGLADALELLVVSVEAGLALEDALDRVVAEMRRSQPVLAEELAMTSADLKILPSRDQALTNLAERVDVPSVRSVVSTLSQTMRYGTPLAQAMRVVASELRNDMLLKLEERANKMPVLLTVPMIVFIMPSVFMIIGGPAFLHLMDIFFK